MSLNRWLAAAAVLVLIGTTAAGAYVSLQSRGKAMSKPSTSEPPAALTDTPPSADAEQRLETATFGAGCFWGVEASFRQIKGVKSTTVGYLGGTFKNPTYKDVCTGRTGHAEVVQVVFDPAEVSYEKLLDVFWKGHNPTTLNRQGPDVGTQYRSAVFYHTPAQREAAEASKQRLQESGKYKTPIVTEITPTSDFYAAEEYHQQYLEKRGLSSCHM